MITVKRLAKTPLPSIPLQLMAEAVLGPDYELSVVICGDKLSRQLNRAWRGKDKPANVLSFPLAKRLGEIFINARRVKLEAEKLQQTTRARYRHLFIHGLLHLKGLNHGSRMDKQEQQLLVQWRNEKYYHRTRHRHSGDSRSRR
ncbi:MAG: rRNA maturation RNase YbeY [Candidatus Vogelbacteria bacterium CG10_big_fil_rev_8_21_14_0_10_50_13]|uniref:Endoribonuclease YbeY n=1 Tax=Candidatus Vogelbacteria bacterium CG10_big_fil_rev_8_21_14_0_10_50_13 TaxID=1975044 RepID=A0A2H0RFR0_9BACT|nr:MAG: rRNA maturation RNase YbeY [Candidatus Vogelbacteria bacterium CG10_big_fil_rev_8_21_14_0_10_50_13]